MLPSLKDAIAAHDVYDIGDCASAFGFVDDAPTCKATEIAKPSRVDYALANGEALHLLKTFEVNGATRPPCAPTRIGS